MPTKYEWHTVNQSTGDIKVFDMRHLALQHITQETPGTILTLEKHSTVITLEGVYGTAQNPLPSPPANPLPTVSKQITYSHITLKG